MHLLSYIVHEDVERTRKKCVNNEAVADEYYAHFSSVLPTSRLHNTIKVCNGFFVVLTILGRISSFQCICWELLSNFRPRFPHLVHYAVGFLAFIWKRKKQAQTVRRK